jgi:hypothetical protein
VQNDLNGVQNERLTPGNGLIGAADELIGVPNGPVSVPFAVRSVVTDRLTTLTRQLACQM